MSDRYARVYYDRIARDPKFDGIRNDHRVMGAWQLLLVEAEKAWPAPAFRPPVAWVPARYFRDLVARKIIDEEPDGRYRMHGLDSERGGRSNRAKHAADAKWAAAGNADSSAGSSADSSADSSAAGNADASASRARAVSSALLSSNSPVEGGVGGDDGRADLEAFLVTRYRPPTPAQRTLMDAYCRTFDVTGPERAARLIYAHPDDPIGALKDDLAAFRDERKAEAEAQEAPKPKRRAGSGLTGVNAELAKLMHEKYEQEGAA